MKMRDVMWILAVLILLVVNPFTLSSQEDRRERRSRRNAERLEALADSTAMPVLSDSLMAVRDSVARADSIAREDSLAMLKKSSLQAPAFTTARDSIIEDFTSSF